MTTHTMTTDAAGGKPLGLLTPDEASRYLQVSRSWLDKSRVYGGGPRFCRIGRRIRYHPDELSSFVAANVRSRTHEPMS